MRAKGIDLSHWQETFKYKGNVDFIIQKVTEGWGWVDPKYEEFWPEVMKAPIKGAYHYFRTEFDPIRQARHFFEITQGQGPGGPCS